MTIKKNIVANYLGQIYCISIGIVITPLYLKYLGPEPYGLIGLYTLIQSWFSVIDAGLNLAVSKEIATAKKKKLSEIYELISSLELIFSFLSLSLIAIVYFTSTWLSTNWLRSEQIEINTISQSLTIMAITISARWYSSVRKSIILGLEDQVWFNVFNIFIASLRFLGAYYLISRISNDIINFFLYQFSVALIEIYILSRRLKYKIPNPEKLRRFNFEKIKPILPLSATVTYTTLLWIVLTQTDKLILSNSLTLTEYGYFSIVALISSGVTMLSLPVLQAITPRMIALTSNGDFDEMIKIYKKSSQVILIITLSSSLTIALNAESLIYSWTGDKPSSLWGKEILFWFSLGNGILSIGSLQYHLQQAFSNLKLHIIGSTISAIIQIPIIYFSIKMHGALGAGVAWFSFRLIWFFLWTPIVHEYLIIGFHKKWLAQDIMPTAIITIISSILINKYLHVDINDSRSMQLIAIFQNGFLLIITSSLSSKTLREKILSKISIFSRLKK